MKKISTILGGLVLGAGLSAALAQPPAGQQPNQPPAGQQPGQVPGGLQQPATPDISDSDLESFVDVQEDLQEIRMDYSGRLEEAGDAEEAASLQQQASEEMVEVLQENGLSVEAYTQIANAIQTDQELRSRVESMMQES